MADVDKNGPTISVNVDTKQARENLSHLDKATEESVKRMNDKFNSFSENVKKTFNDFKNGGGFFSNSSAGSNGNSSSGSNGNSSSGSNNKNKSEETAKQSKKDQVQAKRLDFEQYAAKQRNSMLENGKQLLTTSKSMLLAVTAIAGGGIGAKALLDFAHHIGQLQNFLKGPNSNVTNALAYRNEFRNRNVDDGQYWAAYKNVNDTLNKFQLGNGGLVSREKRWAYSKLREIDHTIQIEQRKNGGLRTDQQFKKTIDAYNKYLATTTDSEALKIEVAKQIVGDDASLIGAIMKGGLNISKADMKQARDEAKAMPKNAELDAEAQKLRIAYETAEAKTLAAITPTAITFLKTLTNFVSNYPQLALATTALATFSGSIFTLLTILKLGKGLFPRFGKSVAKEAAKKVGIGLAGRLLTKVAGPVALAIDLQGSTHQTPEEKAKKIKDYQEQVKKLKQKAQTDIETHGDTVRQVEEATKAKIKYDDRENRLILIDKKGNKIMYVDDLSMTADALIKKAQDAQAPSMLNPFNWGRGANKQTSSNSTGIAKSLSDALIPSARAGDLYKDRFPQSKNSGSGRKVSQDTKETISKMIRDGYRKEGMEDFKADIAIANVNRESGFDIHAVGDNGRSKSLFQLDPYRQSLFAKRYGHPVEQGTAQEIVDFHFWELKNNEKKAGDKLRRAKTREEANQIFVKDYERSFDQNADIQRNMNFLPQAIALGRGQKNIRPISPYQRQAQTKQAQANNTTHNINNSPTVNIHVANGSVENVKKAVQQAVNYPMAKNFNGLSGMS